MANALTVDLQKGQGHDPDQDQSTEEIRDVPQHGQDLVKGKDPDLCQRKSPGRGAEAVLIRDHPRVPDLQAETGKRKCLKITMTMMMK